MENKIKLNFLHVCDYASFGEGGKLNILGIFENITPKSTPYVHPQMFIVSNISFTRSEDIKEIVKIVSDSNVEVAKLEIPISIKIPTGKKIANIGFLGQFNGVKFEKFGKYKIQILINDEFLDEQEIDILNKPK